MKSHDRIDSKHRLSQILCLFVALALFTATNCFAAKGGVTINADSRIALPSITVSASPQSIFSELLTLDLSNKKSHDGWMLTGSVQDNALIGRRHHETIPASLSFKSITWISGGNGSAAGITVFPDGSRIEADPGFGIGNFEIAYEIRYDAPAFPIADDYRGVSTFTLQ